VRFWQTAATASTPCRDCANGSRQRGEVRAGECKLPLLGHARPFLLLLLLLLLARGRNTTGSRPMVCGHCAAAGALVDRAQPLLAGEGVVKGVEKSGWKENC
jgi:hypothetical protein